MRRLTRWMDKVLYSGYADDWDSEMFRDEILKLLRAGHKVLDLGAGAGYVSQMNFRGMASQVCGVDPDERVLVNPYLDEAAVGFSEHIPYPDSTFDLVFSSNVLEHLEHPEATFREVERVLKPGGVFLAKTPNKLHYIPLIARMTPHAMHQVINRLRGRESAETFPTHYSVNTPGDIRRYARKAGLKVARIRLIEGRPEYLRLLPPAYLLGWLYERWVNLVPGFSRFRIVLIATLQKPR